MRPLRLDSLFNNIYFTITLITYILTFSDCLLFGQLVAQHLFLYALNIATTVKVYGLASCLADSAKLWSILLCKFGICSILCKAREYLTIVTNIVSSRLIFSNCIYVYNKSRRAIRRDNFMDVII